MKDNKYKECNSADVEAGTAHPSFWRRLPRIVFFIPFIVLQVSLHAVYCLVHAVITLLQHVLALTWHPVPVAKQLWQRCPGHASKTASVIALSLLFLALALACLTVFGTLPFMPAAGVLLPVLPLWQAVLVSTAVAYIMTIGLTRVCVSFMQHVAVMRHVVKGTDKTFTTDRPLSVRSSLDRTILNQRISRFEVLIAKCDVFCSYPSIEAVDCLDIDENKDVYIHPAPVVALLDGIPNCSHTCDCS